LFKLDMQSRMPIYEQLKNKISELVMMGILGPDDQLPTVRSFARDLGVNPNTVQKAYQELERDKIIYSVAGRGSYISPEIAGSGMLQQRYVQKVMAALQQARQCGIQKERMLQAVQEAYKEDKDD